jgi:hypothetical protein
MPQATERATRSRSRTAAGLVAVLAISFPWVVLAAPGASRADELPPPAAARQESRIGQLPRYSAGGTHQCGSGGSCVVSGSFSNCNDATITLRTRDCCPTTKNGGTSKGFALNYCIPDTLRP